MLALSACATLPAPREGLKDRGALLFNGYANPASDCYRCHGPDARGSGRGPDLVAAARHLPTGVMETILREGSGRMPAYSKVLSDEEVGALIGWLRSLAVPVDGKQRALQAEP